jgi:ribosomal protein L37AE/L43A
METENEPKRARKYHCSCCSYPTSKTSDWKRHLATKKHENNAQATVGNTLTRAADFRNQPRDYSTSENTISLTEIPQNAPQRAAHTCPKCNKTYTGRVGLWKHKKKCIATPQQSGQSIPVHIWTDMIKQDREIRNMLLEQNFLFMRQLAEMTQHPTDTTRPPLLYESSYLPYRHLS